MTTFLVATLRTALIGSGLAVGLSACGTEQPQSTVSRGLVSGVTSNNGGGMAPADFGSTAPIKAR